MTEINRIIVHTDTDGIVSAMILSTLFPDAMVELVQYRTPEWLALEPSGPGTIFADMSPPPDKVVAFANAGAWCLDHHASQRAIVAAFGANGRYAEDKCGAELALEWAREHGLGKVHPMLARMVHLAGVRDLWKNDDPKWADACAMNTAVLFLGWKRLKGRLFLSDEELGIGRALVNHARDTVADALERKLFRVVAVDGVGVRVAIVPRVEGAPVSDLGNAILDADLADVVMIYFDAVNNGRIETVRSLRSKPSVDVGAIAKHTGAGGGHPRAAGFVLPRGSSDEELLSGAFIDALYSPRG